jgi:CRISPR-associated protein Csd1
MLADLARYARSNDVDTEPGFRAKDVRWLLAFTLDGKFVDARPLGDGAGKTIRCPDMQFTSGTNMRHFLVDTAKYFALIGPPETDPKKEATRVAKQKYVATFLEIAGAECKSLAALENVAATLSTHLDDVRAALINQGAKPTDNVTVGFARSGDIPEIPVLSDSWYEWWRAKWPTLAKKRISGGRARCLVTGEPCDPEPTHPRIFGLKDVGGEQASYLVSFNKRAYCSYGFEKSDNASVSKVAAQQYAQALNTLLERTGQRLGNVKVVHWFAGPDETPVELPPGQDALRFVESLDDIFGPPSHVVPANRHTDDNERRATEQHAQALARDFLRSVTSGRRADLADYRYHAMTLSGSSARVMLRGYVTGRFEELCESVEAWFDDLAIAMPLSFNRSRPVASPPKLVQMLYAGLQERPQGQKYEKWILPVDHFREQLWEAALRGARTRLPAALVDRAVRCHVATIASRLALPSPSSSDRRSDADKRYPPTALINRMAIFKAFYNREQRAASQEQLMITPDLDPSHPKSAYHCGRLMAVMEMVQRLALGEVGATIAQTFYASAATRPIAAFGQLLTKSQHHIAKIENFQLRRQYERLMTEISLWIGTSLPRTFDLEDQCIFHLGYYHQRAYQPFMEPPHKHLVGGELRVRSKSEVIICLVLEKLGVKFEYEKELQLGRGAIPIHPDFTVAGTKDGRPIYIEYLGMMDNFAYQSNWNARLTDFESAGVLAVPGGGSAGHLVVIEEGKKGVVDIPSVERQIREQVLPLIA